MAGDEKPTITYGRNAETSTVPGDYTLLGYVNGQSAPVGEATFLTGFGNYYFTTKSNTSLHITADPAPDPVIPDPVVPDPVVPDPVVPNPVTPDPVVPADPGVPDVPATPELPGNLKPLTQAVEETVISDKKFTPDDYSYNRISKDPDLTRVNRESSAMLQYAEKGVNVDDGTKSGLASLADIQGAGSIVNLEGALIRTSVSAEQPETVAAAAALPLAETGSDATITSTFEAVSDSSLTPTSETISDAALTPISAETEENDISSIELEYADNTRSSQSMLEILTKASNNAEKKGTSIVIDTKDEDEEDEEEEKSRRAIFADRSNIGIETLGNGVNLDQMIG